jgi:hypothetical protein
MLTPAQTSSAFRSPGRATIMLKRAGIEVGFRGHSALSSGRRLVRRRAYCFTADGGGANNPSPPSVRTGRVARGGEIDGY